MAQRGEIFARGKFRGFRGFWLKKRLDSFFNLQKVDPPKLILRNYQEVQIMILNNAENYGFSCHR